MTPRCSCCGGYLIPLEPYIDSVMACEACDAVPLMPPDVPPRLYDQDAEA